MEGLCWKSYGKGVVVDIQNCVDGDGSQVFSLTPFGEGYRIRGGKNDSDVLCLDVFGQSRSSGASVGMWTCKDDPGTSANQQFVPVLAGGTSGKAVSLFNLNSQLCVDLPGNGNHGTGTPLEQWTCNGGRNQAFFLPTNTTKPATNVTTINTNATNSTGFGDIVTTIQTLDTPPLCWDAVGSSIVANSCDSGKDSQTWRFYLGQLISAVNGSSRICADISQGSTNDGVNLGLYTCNEGINQLLIFEENGVVNFGNSYKCAGLKGGSAANHAGSTGIEQTTCTNTNAQKFKVVNRTAVESINAAPCSQLRYRKEWRDLTDDEKNDYIRAVDGIRLLPSTAGRRSLFDDIVAVHAVALKYIHGNPIFLPWHRAFLAFYERSLQRIVPSVMVPYWDWGHDGQAPLSNLQLFSNLSTSVGTRGDPNADDPCISDGFAHTWESMYGFCLARNYTDSTTVYDTSVMGPLVNGASNYTQFSMTLETAHNYLHYYIGGIGGDLYYIDTSPNDPIFFLHHANVDRYWYLWQKAHPQSAMDYMGITQLPPGSTNNVRVSPDDMMPGFNTPVKTALLSDGGGDYCIGYIPYSGSIAPPLRRRAENKRRWKRNANVNVTHVGEGSVTTVTVTVTESSSATTTTTSSIMATEVPVVGSPSGSGGGGGEVGNGVVVPVGSGRFGTVHRRKIPALPSSWIKTTHARFSDLHASGVGGGHNDGGNGGLNDDGGVNSNSHTANDGLNEDGGVIGGVGGSNSNSNLGNDVAFMAVLEEIADQEDDAEVVIDHGMNLVLSGPVVALSEAIASADPVKKMRFGESVLSAIADQFDQAMDDYLELNPNAEYDTAFKSILDNWVWTL
ncbi:hypothetical protein HDU76_004926 [Blyttiomyces sp. JEL0837]|nr:hypothetical protein HDU76_004926 [Blyttiomyces sp. JEL0837]